MAVSGWGVFLIILALILIGGGGGYILYALRSFPTYNEQRADY